MVLQVNQELCAGCGMCIGACSVGAIELVDQRAEINDALCTQCEACVDACPNGAITVILEPAHLVPTVELATIETQMIPAPTRTAQPAAEPPNHNLAALAGTALTFLGREVAPRLVDVLVTAIERRLATPAASERTSLSVSPKSSTRTNPGTRRQARYRGGRIGNQKFYERR
jgi:Fe-S-cluster-containing hydrogenase component 2